MNYEETLALLGQAVLDAEQHGEVGAWLGDEGLDVFAVGAWLKGVSLSVGDAEAKDDRSTSVIALLGMGFALGWTARGLRDEGDA